MFDIPSVNLQHHIKYLPSQENIGCCTASATLLAAEMMFNKSNKPTHFSRLFLYYNTRKLQGRIGKKGADLALTLSSLSQFGVCPDTYCPLRRTLVDKEPNARAYDEAIKYRLSSYEEVHNHDYKKYIDDGIPVIVGMFTGRKFWTLNGPIASQSYKPINNDDNRQSKGHAVTIMGYSDILNGGSWIIANSLGTKWGDKGYAAIPYACNVDIGEAFAILKF